MFLLQELNKIDAYTETKVDPQEVIDLFKERFLVQKYISNLLTTDFEEL